MKKILATAMGLIVLAGCQSKAPEVDKGAIVKEAVTAYLSGLGVNRNMVLPEELKPALDAGTVVIIDVGTPEDYLKAHIPGSENIPINDLANPDILSKVPKDKDVVLVSLWGASGAQATVALRLMGYTNVKALIGGTTLWMSKGYPAEGTEIKPAENKPDDKKPRIGH
ncbi:MAG: rhodanese-like domain-containing protein [candidate division WOR-3 bacterium]